MCSFATLAEEKQLIKPKVDLTRSFEIVDGRHLVVEDALKKKNLVPFTANNCDLSSNDIWVISGPNMGGKSTFLRQNAIIAILAQIGCFVPCRKAHIGLVDKIYSRVGSADDLYNDMSTFMVEMVETSLILNGATDRSLAILDEIGRGTSGKEGVAVAYGTLKHLLQNNKCRSLFATHYAQELKQVADQDLSEDTHRIHYFQTSIRETNDPNKFYYDHKMRPGISQKSDALKVARIAGFPQDALKDASTALKLLCSARSI